jgi:hypothetical protein
MYARNPMHLIAIFFIWMSKFNDEAGCGGGYEMVPPLKNEILPITGLVLKLHKLCCHILYLYHFT